MLLAATASIVFAISAVIGWIGVAASARLALWMDALDTPGRRSSHDRPTPRLGGLGIALGAIGGLAASAILVLGISAAPPEQISFPICLCMGGSIALGFGIRDDLKGLSPNVKFLFQAICALIAILFGIGPRTIQLPFMGALDLGLLWPAATALWIVFFMNAFNFMDGMDGHNACFGSIAALAMAALIIVGIDDADASNMRLMALLAIAGGLIGFLPHNMSCPARTFMGDGGSQMIGFAIALCLSAASSRAALPAFLVVWPFIYDVIHTLILRARRGEKLSEAHRDHLYQRLLRAGLSHRQSLAHSLVFQLACVAGAFMTACGSAKAAAGAAAGLTVVAAATILYTARVVRVERRFVALSREAN